MKTLLPILAIGVLASCQSTQPTVDNFTLADVDSNGGLSRPEMSDYVVGLVFGVRDTNKDGIMTPQEWNPDNLVAGTEHIRNRDTNHDGNVSLAEARAYGRTAHLQDRAFAELDANKDGQVSRAEVANYDPAKGQM